MKKTGFFRLFLRSLPEIWFCQVVIGAILWFPTTPHRNAWQSERCGVYKRRHLETHIKHSFKTLYFDQ